MQYAVCNYKTFVQHYHKEYLGAAEKVKFSYFNGVLRAIC